MRAIDKKPGQASKQPKRELKRRSEVILPSFTPEDLIKLGKQYAGHESPIDISFSILTEANIRPLEWINFEKNPKRMKISNSGTTAILSAKWHGPRPYLSKGPLSGYYVFSQLHFHWGSSAEEGSEHTMDGKSYPLEAHAMFFKNTYLTQEDAMKQTDGTITVAYLFYLQATDNEDFEPIISALKEIQQPLNSHHLELLPLEKFLHIFTDDYFMYWGNVVNRSILWLICRKNIGISARQLSFFHSMIGTNQKPITKNFRGPKEINHRIIYHINPSRHRSDLLICTLGRDSRGSNRKMKSAKSPVGTGDGKPKHDGIARDVSAENVYHCQNDESVNINISVLTGDNLEKKSSRSAVYEGDDVFSLHTCPSKNDAISLEKRRKSQIKFQLASALLNLEKEEGNDYGFLENYIKTKFDTFQQETCYSMPSDERLEKMLLPSVRSLHMNSSEELDTAMAQGIKDKSKSDTNCLKTYGTSGTESDLEIGEDNKSGWSSMNNVSEKEGRGEGEEDPILPSRPKTSAAMLNEQPPSIVDEPMGRVLNLRSSSQLSHLGTPPQSSGSANRFVLVRELSSEGCKARTENLRENSGKSIVSAVDEARSKIRSSLRQSLSKLRGTPPKNPSRNLKPDSRSPRPAWRY